jgi:hypothetical protein
MLIQTDGQIDWCCTFLVRGRKTEASEPNYSKQSLNSFHFRNSNSVSDRAVSVPAGGVYEILVR